MNLISSLSELNHLYTGKVREVYEVDAKHLLLMTSRRISAFDVVFPEPIPNKAEVLNLMSGHWFERTRGILPNHLVTTRSDRIFAPGSGELAEMRGRVALVRRTDPVKFECVVRGHLDGSAWREYQATGGACGYKLPKGLKRYDKLPEPLFTPSTKAEVGHDENITVEEMARQAGEELTRRLQATSLALYNSVYAELQERDVLCLDTKFEFGMTPEGELLLIDEAFTPDSSRFRVECKDGEGEALALDKQYLRDWLQAQGFMGDGTPPKIPQEVIAEISRRYEVAFEMITGEPLAEALQRRG